MWWWLPAPPVWTTWPISWPEQIRTGPRCRCSAALFGVSRTKLHTQYCAPRSWAKARAHEVFAHHVRLPRRGEKMAHLVFLLCFCIAKIHRISRCIFLAQWEGFELEKAFSRCAFLMIFTLFPAFVRHTPSFCSASLFCFKGENKGEKLGLSPAALLPPWALLPPCALLRPVRDRRGCGDQMQSGGAAAALGAPAACVRPLGLWRSDAVRRRCCRPGRSCGLRAAAGPW